MREGTLRVLEDEIISIDDEETFKSAVSDLLMLVTRFKENPFARAMGAASMMGTHVGIIYNSMDDDSYDQVGNDRMFQASDDVQIASFSF